MSEKPSQKEEKEDSEIIDIDEQIRMSEDKNSSSSGDEIIGSINTTKSSLTKIADKNMLSEVQKLYKQLEEKDEEYNKIYNRYLRALADYENLQKRIKEERAKFIKNANENLLIKLLDLADTFEKAKATITSGEANKTDLIKDGFQTVSKQFNSILKNEGVERIQAVGKKFDPNYHEAIFVKPDTDVEDDTVLEEVQIGYLLNSSLLRPTKVIIAKRNTKGDK